MTVLTDAMFYAPLKTSLALTNGIGNPAFNRATLATIFDNEDKLITLPLNAARFGGARTVYNQIGSSPILATQSITTTADIYTLSFKGTGTVTLSGTYAGSLVGTGASNRAQTTFTATAGTLTLTVSGSCTEAQLELVTGQADQTASEYIDTSLMKYDVVQSPLDLTVSPWTYANGAVTPNVYTNPIDGLQNVVNFVPTSAASVVHYVTQNTVYGSLVNGSTVTVYAKLTSNIHKVSLWVGVGSNTFASFNLTTVVAAKDSNVYSAKITSLGDGWFKLEGVWNSVIPAASVRIYVSSGAYGGAATTEDGVSGIGIYLPSAGPVDCIKHYDTNKDGSAIADSDLHRLLMNPAARTNNLLWGRSLGNTVWFSNTQGAEILLNPNFDSNITNWTDASEAGGSIAWDALGYISLTAGDTTGNTEAIAYQTITTVVGETYTLSYVRVNGSPVIQIGTFIGDNTNYGNSGSTSDTINFKATSTTTYVTLKNFNTASAIKISSVSIKLAGIAPTANQTGIDGKANSCSLLTARVTDATILQTITAAATAACSSFYVKRSTGTGTISFTRDGGTSWTNITSLINSSTFTRVKIENTSVTNPQVGFKIATSGDAIIVDYGQNEAGTEVSMPILTTTAAATRNADVLTYQTASNFSDTAGTILATVERENWTNGNGSAVGSSTRGLYTSASNSGVQALDGTNTVNGPTGTPTGQKIIACKWATTALTAAANGTVGTPGSYDGAFNLSTIGIMAGTNGYIGDVYIWNSALSDDALSYFSFPSYDDHVSSLVAATNPCVCLKISLYNAKLDAQFIQLHDAASLPAEGSVPKVTVLVQAQSNMDLSYTDKGRKFDQGIVICNSMTQETLTLGNNDLLINESLLVPAVR